MPRQPMPDVVVVLPGILGSVLKRGRKTVWGFAPGVLGGALLRGGASFRDALWLDHDDLERDDLDDGIRAHALMPDIHLIPGFWKIDGYSTLVDAIQATFDVTPGKNFFTFPYDWRRDNRVAARRLARQSHGWLRSWRRSGNADAKLILIGHSMGGLVARYFLEVLEGWRDARALITFGTPYRGSLNAVETLANGVRKGPLALDDLTVLCRRFTSMYQLLPTYRSFDAGDGLLVRVGEVQGIPNVDAAKAKDALEAFHREIQRAVAANSLEPAYEQLGNWVRPIVGIGQETNQSARKHGAGVQMFKHHDGTDHSGDGTVPRVSAVPIEYGDRHTEMFAGTKHGSLQNADAVIRHVAGVIQSLYLDLGDFLAPSPVLEQVALELPDVTWADEPVVVRARVDVDAPLTATLLDGATGSQVAQIALDEAGDGWRAGAFDPPPPGGYTVRVSGGAGVEPVMDALAVADASAGDGEG